MDRKIKNFISIVVPCFDEEERIVPRFEESYKFFKRNLESFEIILVNDGSRDQTLNVLNKLAKKYKNVKVLSYDKNQGKGYALKKGVMAAGGEIVGMMDADFSISVEETNKFIEKINEGADIVIGDRRNKGAEKTSKLSISRKFLGKLLSYINGYFLNFRDIKDTQCGFKFYKGKVAKKIFSSLSINRWLFDLEVLLKARQENFKIIKLEVKWKHIGNSKVNAIKDFLPVGFDLLKIYLKFINIKIFMAISLFVAIIIMIPFLINPQSLVERAGDYSDLVWPDYAFIKQDIVQNHEIPLWNPTLFSGIPEIANPQSPLIYPPNALMLILPVGYTVVILVILHALLSNLFMFLTTKKVLKFSSQAALVASFGFTFSPYLWGRVGIGHLSMSLAFFILPAVIYFGIKFYLHQKPADLFFMSLFLALQYLNYPTIWYYSCFFGMIACSILLTYQKKYMRIFVFGLGVVMSLVLIAPIFLIQIQAGSWITRSSLTFSDLAIPLWSLKRFIFSIFIPSNFLHDPESEVWLYPSILLILASIYGYIKLNNRFKVVMGLIIGLAIFITLGNRTPVFGLFNKFIPGFSYLRVSTRVWFVLLISLAILGGWAVNKLPKFKTIAAVFILMDLVIFSALRIWYYPIDSSQYNSINWNVLLNQDNNFRYYCTRRCISAQLSVPRGINTADGYHLVILKKYQHAISDAGGFAPTPYSGNIPSYDMALMQPSAEKLGSFAVKWVISDNNLTDPGFRKIDFQTPYYLYQNLKVLPRFRFQNEINNKIEVIEDTPNHIVLKTLGKEGTLVLADSYFPGWEARVNNKLVHINLWDNWARSIDVPEGINIVEFEFRPFSGLINI